MTLGMPDHIHYGFYYRGEPPSWEDMKGVPPLAKNLLIPCLDKLSQQTPLLQQIFITPTKFRNSHYNNFHVITQQKLHFSCSHCSCIYHFYFNSNGAHRSSVHPGNAHSHHPIKRSPQQSSPYISLDYIPLHSTWKTLPI